MTPIFESTALDLLQKRLKPLSIISPLQILPNLIPFYEPIPRSSIPKFPSILWSNISDPNPTTIQRPNIRPLSNDVNASPCIQPHFLLEHSTEIWCTPPIHLLQQTDHENFPTFFDSTLIQSLRINFNPTYARSIILCAFRYTYSRALGIFPSNKIKG